jgi:hypothetical protein
MKFVQLDDIKSYLYQSRAKIDSLYAQIQEPKKKTKLKWKIDWKVFSAEREVERELDLNDEDKLRAVVAELETQQLVGTIEERKPYIKGIFPMKWGLYDDSGMRPNNEGPLVYFGGIQDGMLLGLGGSSHHVIGLYGLSSTGSRSATPVLVAFLRSGLDSGEVPSLYRSVPRDDMGELYEAMALANHYLKEPIQSLEFVAKVICRDRQRRLRPFNDTDREKSYLQRRSLSLRSIPWKRMTDLPVLRQFAVAPASPS